MRLPAAKPKSANEYALPSTVKNTVGLCKAGHSWPLVLVTTQFRRMGDNKHLRNEFLADVPSCPTCGLDLYHVDPSRLG